MNLFSRTGRAVPNTKQLSHEAQEIENRVAEGLEAQLETLDASLVKMEALAQAWMGLGDEGAAWNCVHEFAKKKGRAGPSVICHL